MMITRLCTGLFLLSLACCLALSGCSKEKEPEKQAFQLTPAQKQAKEAIQDFGKTRTDKARAAANLADDREKAIDGALQNLNKK